MIFSFVVGLVLGGSDVAFRTFIMVMIGFVLLRGAMEIGLRRSWFTGGPSGFERYRENLAGTGSPASRVTYFSMLVGAGLATGLAGYALGRLFA